MGDGTLDLMFLQQGKMLLVRVNEESGDVYLQLMDPATKKPKFVCVNELYELNKSMSRDDYESQYDHMRGMIKRMDEKGIIQYVSNELNKSGFQFIRRM